MNLTKWATIAEIVSALAVIITLLILIVEIRNNTTALEGNAIQETSKLWGEVNLHLAEIDGITDLIFKLNNDPESLTQAESAKVRAFVQYSLATINSSYHLITSGYLPDQEEIAFTNRMRAGFESVPYLRTAISRCDGCYSEGFLAWIGY